jgi:hypothetical protein
VNPNGCRQSEPHVGTCRGAVDQAQSVTGARLLRFRVHRNLYVSNDSAVSDPASLTKAGSQYTGSVRPSARGVAQSKGRLSLHFCRGWLKGTPGLKTFTGSSDTSLDG